MAPAKKLFNYRVVADNGVLILKIFKIEPDAKRPCGYHYSLVYIPFWVEDKHLKQNYLRYDNAHDGPHKHKRGKRLPYSFTEPKKLLLDFLLELMEMLKEDNQPFEEISELLEELKEVEI
ncbi:MAG: hypothetical protein GXN97_06430 [Aquificae bacterium]|nr:hypothetical protein [Aquificota bacterium]